MTTPFLVMGLLSGCAPPTVAINEFMASNATVLADESGAFPDWIELYNPARRAVDLEGWTLTDDLSVPARHTLASGLVIEAGSYLVLFADGDTEEGDLHLNFGLDAGGEDIGLFAPDGEQVDAVSYLQQTTDRATGRVPDGGQDWVEGIEDPTPGAPNGGG